MALTRDIDDRIDDHEADPTAHAAAIATAAVAAANAAVATHAGAADPHTGYQKESEKAAANGYASLDAGTQVPIAQIPPVVQIEETSGPDVLDIADVADGEYLRRVGTEIVGSTPAGAGNFALNKRVITADTTVDAGYSAYVCGPLELAAGIVIEVEADGILEVG